MDNYKEWLKGLKVGDTVLIFVSNSLTVYGQVWKSSKVKKISPKRGDITLEDGSTFEKDGHLKSLGYSRGGGRLKPPTPENITIYTRYYRLTKALRAAKNIETLLTAKAFQIDIEKDQDPWINEALSDVLIKLEESLKILTELKEKEVDTEKD